MANEQNQLTVTVTVTKNAAGEITKVVESGGYGSATVTTNFTYVTGS